MFKSKLTYLIAFIAITLIYSCNETEPTLTDQEKGSIQLSIGFDIDETPIDSYSRTAASTVNTDDFKITIFTEDGDEYLEIDRYADTSEGIALPSGIYYIEAYSADDMAAAFDAPFYFGKSELFSIDKNENKSVHVEATLANTQVSIILLEDQAGAFSDYATTVEHIETSEKLTFTADESRSGYFRPGDLYIQASITYNDSDGTPIEQTIATEIKDAKPKTHYEVKINLKLEDGKIIPVVTVDEDVDIVEVDLTASSYSLAWTDTILTLDYYRYESILFPSIIGTSDGGILVTFNSENDIYINKTNQDGTQEWIKNYSDTYNDVFQKVIETHDQNFAFFGSLLIPDYEPVSVIKLDALAENKIWERPIYEEPAHDPHELIETADHHIVATGIAYDAYGSNKKGQTFFTKITEDGQQRVWTRRYELDNRHGIDPNGIDLFSETSDGNFIIVSSTWSRASWVALISGETGEIITDRVISEYIYRPYWFAEGDNISVLYQNNDEQYYVGQLDIEDLSISSFPLSNFNTNGAANLGDQYRLRTAFRGYYNNYLALVEDRETGQNQLIEYNQNFMFMSQSPFEISGSLYRIGIKQPLADGTVVVFQSEDVMDEDRIYVTISGYKKE